MALKSNLLKLSDFEMVGLVAKHCNYSKLDIAIREAMEFDLRPLLCGLFWEVKNNWWKANSYDNSFGESFEGSDQDIAWMKLVNGSSYEGCGGTQKAHRGLKALLTYYSYSRYLVLNGFDDTPNGMVQKTNQFSIPKPLKEIQSFSNKYRSMAKNVWEDIQAFICVNKEDYQGADFSKCGSCGCGGNDCGSGRITKGFGISGQNVTKYGM